MQNPRTLRFTAEKSFQKLFLTANKKNEAISFLNTMLMKTDDKISNFSIQGKRYKKGNGTQILITATTDTNKSISIHITFSDIPGMLERVQKRFSMLLAENTGPEENSSQQYDSSIHTVSPTSPKEELVTVRIPMYLQINNGKGVWVARKSEGHNIN